MATEIPLCDYSKMLRERTIVILGETGVGKSSLINNSALIIRFPTLNEAIRGADDFILPIPARGIFKGMDISEGSDSNERNERGRSRTREPRVYRIQSGSCVLNIIDTPGIADSGGLQVDNKHIENITACIRKFEEIHAILIVVNSSNNTLTTGLKSTLNELLSCLGKTAAKQICFAVTRVYHTMEMSDASDAIAEYINNLRDNPGIELNRSNMFGFEALPFHYFMALKKGLVQEMAFDKAYYSLVYENNRVELLRLFKRIYNCSEPYNVMSARALILAKQIQPKLSSLLADLSEVDTRTSKDLVKLKLKLLHWREKQASLELDKYKEELEQANKWSDKILNSLCTITSITASGMASGAATGAAAGAFTGLGVASPHAAALGGVVGGTVGGTVGLVTGITLTYNSHSETDGSEIGKLAEVVRQEVIKIQELKQKKATKFEKFKTEQNMLHHLLQDINAYLQQHSIIMSDKIGTAVIENETFEYSLNDSLAYDDTAVNSTDVQSQVVIPSISNNCNSLSPETLYGRLYAMTSLKYFGKDIAVILQKCKNLENTSYEGVEIIVESNNCFFQEMTSS